LGNEKRKMGRCGGFYRGPKLGGGGRVSGRGGAMDGSGHSRAGRGSGLSWKTSLTRWPHLSASKRRKGETPLGAGRWAVGQIWSWAGLVPAALLHLFFVLSFFFFCFLFFITFAKELQIKSNMILKFSKIQNNLLKQ
jgi:hypothetical protein